MGIQHHVSTNWCARPLFETFRYCCCSSEWQHRLGTIRRRCAGTTRHCEQGFQKPWTCRRVARDEAFRFVLRVCCLDGTEFRWFT